MNHSFAAITVRIFLLDHGRRITWLSLLDNGGAITITITIMIARLADRYAGADRPRMNTNLIRKGRLREREACRWLVSTRAKRMKLSTMVLASVLPVPESSAR
jgi:hypothetical protein